MSHPIRRAVAPQALRPFTRLDQVTQLVKVSEADPDTGFMARLLALCSLPRTNPGNRLQYVRRNGPYTLYMTATGSAKLLCLLFIHPRARNLISLRSAGTMPA